MMVPGDEDSSLKTNILGAVTSIIQTFMVLYTSALIERRSYNATHDYVAFAENSPRRPAVAAVVGASTENSTPPAPPTDGR